MLYSESKERENQFIISLKIGFPFLVLTLVLFYVFQISANTLENLLLTVTLIPIYIYYIFYLIYRGFQSTLIESVTRTFTKDEILKRIKKAKKNTVVVLIRIDNIADIDKRYSLKVADEILRKFCQKLDNFLRNYNFKNVPIGRYGGGNFLFIVKGREKELNHILTIFSKELKNIGIDDVEIKVDFSLVESNYDKNIENIVKKLFFDIEEHKELSFLNVKPDEYEKIVLEALKNEKFIFKYQPCLDYLGKIKILEVLTKVYSKSHGMLSFSQIERVINHMGYENIFYKKLFKVLCNEIQNLQNPEICFSVKISPVTLRNNEFIVYLNQLFYVNKIDPKNIILEFSEENFYKETKRFEEILKQYKKMGFKISIDNFGGNNSSIEYLKYLPLDLVKFDIEFTKNLEDERYLKLLKFYISMLKELKIKVMIKFIDKKSIFETIQRYNPDFIQGFIVSKPKNLKQIKDML